MTEPNSEKIPQTQNEAPAPQRSRFRRITKQFNPSGGSRRGEPKLAITSTGLVRSNSEAKTMILAFIQRNGGDPNNFQFAFGADENLGQLALYVPTSEDLVVMKVKVHKNSVGFHAGAVFRECPLLRPNTTVDCFLTDEADEAGVHCLVVQIRGASPTRTVPRKKKKADPAQQTDPNKTDPTKTDPNSPPK
jgi:hypothetical protein